MKDIVFATNNEHKLREVRQMVGDGWRVLGLKDIGCADDIPETADTLRGNALIKARWIRDRYGYDCFADDTGLLVDALGGAPGVLSARYAGDGHDSQANMALLLENMKGIADRSAHFSTVICLATAAGEQFFEGECRGTITTGPRGTDGFGYDPVFAPDEADVTFAEMSPEAKNAISHRGRAFRKFAEYFKTHY